MAKVGPQGFEDVAEKGLWVCPPRKMLKRQHSAPVHWILSGNGLGCL